MFGACGACPQTEARSFEMVFTAAHFSRLLVP
jgi:hypothetical protein